MGLLGDLVEELLHPVDRVLTLVVREAKLGRTAQAEARARQAAEASAGPVESPERGATLSFFGVLGEQAHGHAGDAKVGRHAHLGDHQPGELGISELATERLAELRPQ